MAEISENYLEFKGTQNFNRIPLICIEDQWYINTGKNSITKVQDSKSTHTWTLQQGHIHYFTTPTAYFKGRLYSVMDDTVLLKWSSEDKNLENADRVEFQEEVHSLIHIPKAEPLIVFQSGKFTISDEFLHPSLLESMKLKKGEYLEWVDAVLSVTSIEIFYLAFNKKNKQRTLYCFSVNKEDKTVSSPGSFRVSKKNGSFKACCLNHQNLSFSHYSKNLESSATLKQNMIERYDEALVDMVPRSDGSLLCYRKTDSANNVILSLKDVCVDTITNICCIDSKHIVIAKGKLKSDECVVEIWDIEHVLLRGSRKIKSPELVTLQISATNDYIFLNFVSDKLIAIPYILDSSFASTLNTSEPKEILQLAWNTDLTVKQIPVEDEPMDISIFNARSEKNKGLESIEELTKKLLDESSYDLKFISESELIKMLKLAIRYQKENQNNLNKDMYKLLNIIFSASFNDVLLIKHLKVLNIVDILDTLNILLKYLKHCVNMPVDVIHKPSDLQVVNWICLVISSHTETLLFTNDKAAKKLLKDLKKTLSVKIQEFEDLEGLQSYLSICCSKKDILPQQYSVEKYCLESLYV